MYTRLFASLVLAATLATPAMAQQTIKIGELNSYKAFPAFLDPYKKGMEMVNGTMIEIDGGQDKPLMDRFRDKPGG